MAEIQTINKILTSNIHVIYEKKGSEINKLNCIETKIPIEVNGYGDFGPIYGLNGQMWIMR